MQRRQLLAAGGAGLLGSLLAACGGGADTPADLADARDDALGRTSSSTLAAPTATAPKVVVIGGGMAGATVAKYLRLWGGNIDVTLVERNPKYLSCIMSSLVLTGQRGMDSLTFGYDTLRSRYGIKTVFEEVISLDPVGLKVVLQSGTTLKADRIVVAPGIAFDDVPGLSANPDAMPHAWKAGPQTTLLAQQLAAMPAGGTAILTIPKTPYRCPPGPYERACLIADWLKLKKPGSKLLVLDANPDYVTERDNFSAAFTGLHQSVVSYVPNAEVTAVDTATRTLYTPMGTFRGDVVNLIPRQRAGALIAQAGLNNATEGRFAAVDVLSYAHTQYPNVHVIGDSSATTQPKAGHIANQEAKVCADAIVRLFAGGQPDPAPVTNSACFSTITMTQASWLQAVFQYDPVKRQMVAMPAASGASLGWNGDHFEDMGTWFQALMGDSFA